MKQETIKATLTMGEDNGLSLRLFLNDEQKQKFILQKGRQPEGLFKVIIL